MNIKKLMIVSLVVLAMTAVAFGQGRGRGRGMCYQQLQVQAPVMIEGKIIKVESVNYGWGRYGQGLHLWVRYNDQESEIHLGPQLWLNNQGLQLKQGDTVKLKAFKGIYNGKPALFAAEVFGAKGTDTIILRDQYGFPMWRQSLRGGRGRGYGRGPGQGRGWNKW